MKRHIDGKTVTLVPRDANAVGLGVSAANHPDGLLQAVMTVSTADLGDFRILLTAQDLGLLAVVSKTLLTMSANQAANLHHQLTDPGRDQQ